MINGNTRSQQLKRIEDLLKNINKEDQKYEEADYSKIRVWVKEIHDMGVEALEILLLLYGCPNLVDDDDTTLSQQCLVDAVREALEQQVGK